MFVNYVIEHSVAVGMVPKLYEQVYHEEHLCVVVAIEEVERFDPPRMEQFDNRMVAQAGIYRFTLEPVTSEGRA